VGERKGKCGGQAGEVRALVMEEEAELREESNVGPGAGWGRNPMGAEAVGQSMDGRAAPAASARGGGLCSVVWWVFEGMGGSRVTSWRVGSVEGTRGRGRERLERVPVETGMVRGASVIFWKTAGRNFDCAASVRKLW